MSFLQRAGLLCLALMLVGLPERARATGAHDACTGFIDTLPATVSSPGHWCLRKNLGFSSAQGEAIDVASDEVTIDCNGFMIAGRPADPATMAVGIGSRDRRNVTVRNCRIRGFHAGIWLRGGRGHLVEDNHLDNNRYAGMQVEGDQSVIRRNRILDTGNPLDDQPAGIYADGTIDILGNTVSGVSATPGSNYYALGIASASGEGQSIAGNRVRDVTGDGSGGTLGIMLSGARVVVRGNKVINSRPGGSLSRAIVCNDGSLVDHASDNILSGFQFAMTNCADAGGNDVAP